MLILFGYTQKLCFTAKSRVLYKLYACGEGSPRPAGGAGAFDWVAGRVLDYRKFSKFGAKMRKRKSITPELCRGARAILGWSQQDLAARAEIARTTIADYELGQIAPQARTLRDLVAALEAAGIEFVPPTENVSRGGVMLKWDNTAGRRKEP